MVATTTSPGLSDRWRNVACYFGLGPLVKFRRSQMSDPVFERHQTQSWVVVFLFFSWLALFLSIDLLEYFILVHFPDLDRRLDPWELALVGGMLLLLGSVVVVWIVLIGLALGGSTRSVPGLKQLVRCKWIIRFASVLNGWFLVCVPIMVGFACFATLQTRRSGDRAAVYFLYDNGIPLPRWGYAMGLLPLCWQAQQNWGKESVVLDQLNAETLRMAFAHGKVVILATHGAAGYVYAFNRILPQEGVGTRYVAPADLGVVDEMKNSRFVVTGLREANTNWGVPENIPVSSDLRLAYLFACHAGNRAAQWKEHLAPADVVIYNRASGIWDHAWWFLVTGPKKLKELNVPQ